MADGNDGRLYFGCLDSLQTCGGADEEVFQEEQFFRSCIWGAMKDWILFISAIINLVLLGVLVFLNDRYGLLAKVQQVDLEEGLGKI